MKIGILERTFWRLYTLFNVNNDLGIVMKAINNRIIDTLWKLIINFLMTEKRSRFRQYIT